MKRVCMTVAAALLAAAPWALGEERPDFSGEWSLNKEKSRLPAEIMASLQSGVVTIDHRDPTFKFHRVFSVFGQDVAQSIELLTNGVEIERAQGERQATSRMYWEGDVLVLVTRMFASSGEALNTVHYRLKEAGKVLEAEEDFRSPVMNTINLWVFDRRETAPAITPTPGSAP